MFLARLRVQQPQLAMASRLRASNTLRLFVEESDKDNRPTMPKQLTTLICQRVSSSRYTKVTIQLDCQLHQRRIYELSATTVYHPFDRDVLDGRRLQQGRQNFVGIDFNVGVALWVTVRRGDEFTSLTRHTPKTHLLLCATSRKTTRTTFERKPWVIPDAALGNAPPPTPRSQTIPA